MQRLFIVKETGERGDGASDILKVNDFIGNKGKIVMMKAYGISAISAGGSSSAHGGRQAGRILIVADNGEDDKIGL